MWFNSRSSTDPNELDWGVLDDQCAQLVADWHRLPSTGDRAKVIGGCEALVLNAVGHCSAEMRGRLVAAYDAETALLQRRQRAPQDGTLDGSNRSLRSNDTELPPSVGPPSQWKDLTYRQLCQYCKERKVRSKSRYRLVHPMQYSPPPPAKWPTR